MYTSDFLILIVNKKFNQHIKSHKDTFHYIINNQGKWHS